MEQRNLNIVQAVIGERRKVAVWLWCLALLFLFGSCSTAPKVYRSDNYIVYQAREGDTPEKLAQEYLGSSDLAWMIEEENRGAPFQPGGFITIPLIPENKAGLARDGYQVVPVLCYHHFGMACDSPLCMPADVFENQMQYLADNGFRVISLTRLYEFLQYRKSIPDKAVVITIDDGYRSVYEIAYPILKRYGFPATLFIYTDFVGKSSSAVTWKQLREMKAADFEIGSHTLSHCDLAKKREGEETPVYETRIQQELVLSKQILDEQLEQDTIYFAFPYSSYNQRVLAICDQVGYRLALTVQRGGNPFFSDPMLLKRNQILKKDMDSFARNLRTFHTVSLR
jgi:peptidoglycan/xylan/chitin deacetylase (PgdA/CDA1 family)